MTAYVYGLKDSTGKFRYVGVTKDPTRRQLEHLENKSSCEPLRIWYASYTGILEFVVLEEVDHLLKFRSESKWINKLKREGHPLLNTGWTEERRRAASRRMQGNRLNDGKQASPAYVRTPEIRKQISEKLRQMWIERKKRGLYGRISDC